VKLPDTIVMASGNAGKIKEIARLLVHLDVNIVPQSECGVSEADETGTTFEENAIIKARHAAIVTGLPAIADDSGLTVDALDGRPGVHSARYSGPGASDDSNIEKLLNELQAVDAGDRGAAFHCVACFMLTPDAEPLIANGSWRGEILTARRGDGGFGYDPVFLDPASGKASAELTAAEKNARSHRGKALRKLAELLGATPASR
jgi:XTP/dITP diphosphohydrolase